MELYCFQFLMWKVKWYNIIWKINEKDKDACGN